MMIPITKLLLIIDLTIITNVIMNNNKNEK